MRPSAPKVSWTGPRSAPHSGQLSLGSCSMPGLDTPVGSADTESHRACPHQVLVLNPCSLICILSPF